MRLLPKSCRAVHVPQRPAPPSGRPRGAPPGHPSPCGLTMPARGLCSGMGAGGQARAAQDLVLTSAGPLAPRRRGRAGHPFLIRRLVLHPASCQRSGRGNGAQLKDQARSGQTGEWPGVSAVAETLPPRGDREAALRSWPPRERYSPSLGPASGWGRLQPLGRCGGATRANKPGHTLEASSVTLSALPLPHSKMKFEITDEQVCYGLRGLDLCSWAVCIVPLPPALLPPRICPRPASSSRCAAAGADGQRPGVRRFQHLCRGGEWGRIREGVCGLVLRRSPPHACLACHHAARCAHPPLQAPEQYNKTFLTTASSPLAGGEEGPGRLRPAAAGAAGGSCAPPTSQQLRLTQGYELRCCRPSPTPRP